MARREATVHYPMLLTGKSRRALVVGAGTVARRKVAALQEAGVEVTVLAPHASSLEGVTAIDGVWPQSAPALVSFDLVFAATDNRAVNADIARCAREAHVWVNLADSPEESDFYTVATIRHEGALIAISTAGLDPARAKELRLRLEGFLNGEASGSAPGTPHPPKGSS